MKGTESIGRGGRIGLRRDAISWPDGLQSEQTVIEGPQSVFMVPVWPDGRTLLVRQWRHAWDSDSWEVPAGTLEEGEDPLEGARRELVEEAGLAAAGWVPLGVARSTAAGNMLGHLYLARELSSVPRAPEAYEQDMITLELPLQEAVEEALSGGILHSVSVAALLRAARSLGVI